MMFLMTGCVSFSPQAISGQHHLPGNLLIEYIPGNLPIVISAPHGGRLAPDHIPDRSRGKLRPDRNTDLLARDIADALFLRTNKYPHLIICHVARRKVDCNRDLKEGAQNNKHARNIWNQYHHSIEKSIQTLLQNHPQGLYLDLHGHGHPHAKLELGYLIRNKNLKQPDEQINRLADKSSIAGIAAKSSLHFSQLLRGPASFGALMHEKGYPSIPSPAHPDAGDIPFFSGGYNTKYYCSRQDNRISGFQVESPFKGVRDTDNHRKIFADAFVDAVICYMDRHFDIQLNQP